MKRSRLVIRARGYLFAVLLAAHLVAVPEVHSSQEESGGLALLDGLLRVPQVAALELSPDGSRIAFEVAPQDFSPEEERGSEIRLLDCDHGEERALARGRHPRWAPDGKRIAFLAPRATGTRLMAIDVEGRETRVLLPIEEDDDGRISVLDFEWSPSGDRLAAIVSDPTTKAGATNPRVVVIARDLSPISEADASANFLAVLDLATRKMERLTGPELSVSPGARMSNIDWAPDGRRIAFVARRADCCAMGGNEMNADDVYWLDSKDPSALHQVKGQALGESSPLWSQSGSMLALISNDGTSVYERKRSIVLETPDDENRRTVVPVEATGFHGGYPISWSSASDAVYAIIGEGATAALQVISLPSGQLRRVSPESMSVSLYSRSSDGRHLAVAMGDANNPDEIFITDTTGDEPWRFRRLTHLARPLEKALLGKVERLQWRSKDGRFPVEGFLVKPPAHDASRPYPLLVQLHGGPGSPYRNRFLDINVGGGIYFWPAQLYASRGFLVLLPNPRGDTGYSRQYLEALRKSWGTEYEQDVEPGVNMLVARGAADPKRLAIAGQSYGAYLTAVALTKTTRYRAASFSDGPVNLIGLYAGLWPPFAEFEQYYHGADSVDRDTRLVTQSPILAARNIRTPTLIRAGNIRVGFKTYGALDQARQLFGTLRQQNVPAVLVIHNEEGHGIAARDTYLDYVAQNLKWFEYWLLGKGESPLAGGSH